MQLSQALGESDDHIQYRSLNEDQNPIGLSQVTWPAFDRLRARASEEGFDLRIASGFRDAQRQQLIWDGKASGLRPVLDSDCQRIDIASLSEKNAVWAILRWSALPCVSRHHWGSDFDFYDAAAVSEDYPLQLIQSEYSAGGVFASLNSWLSDMIQTDGCEGFFRPYGVDRDGVAPEPWHLSYAPAAAQAHLLCRSDLLRTAVQLRNLKLGEVVESHWNEIFAQFIDVDVACYPRSFQPLLRSISDKS